MGSVTGRQSSPCVADTNAFSGSDVITVVGILAERWSGAAGNGRGTRLRRMSLEGPGADTSGDVIGPFPP